MYRQFHTPAIARSPRKSKPTKTICRRCTRRVDRTWMFVEVCHEIIMIFWWFGTFLIFPSQLGMSSSSSQLPNSYVSEGLKLNHLPVLSRHSSSRHELARRCSSERGFTYAVRWAYAQAVSHRSSYRKSIELFFVIFYELDELITYISCTFNAPEEHMDLHVTLWFFHIAMVYMAHRNR